MNKSIFKGIITGTLYILIIFSTCLVTFYGTEYGMSFDIGVMAISFVYLIIAEIIAFIISKTKIACTISKISKIISIIVGIVVVISAFVNSIFNFTTIKYVMPGPIVLLPNIIWLFVITFFTLANINFGNKENKDLLKFFIGAIVSVVVLYLVNIVLKMYIDSGVTMSVNEIINIILRAVCGTGIAGYSIYGFIKQENNKEN
mgnify:FL=1